MAIMYRDPHSVSWDHGTQRSPTQRGKPSSMTDQVSSACPMEIAPKTQTTGRPGRYSPSRAIWGLQARLVRPDPKDRPARPEQPAALAPLVRGDRLAHLGQSVP